jgi:hypothetical protein
MPWWSQSSADKLISRVTLTDKALVGAIEGLTTPTRVRAKRKPQAPIRRTSIADLARNWTSRLDTFTRLGMTVDLDEDGKGILISDCRLTSLQFIMADWPGYEPGLGAVLIRFRVAPRDVSLSTERLAFISKHALGRRFHRGATQDDEAVVADLQRLVIRHDDMLTRSPFACRVPSGVWAGEVTPLKGRPEKVLVVRTFLGLRELKQ